jgi:hypothetical protein
MTDENENNFDIEKDIIECENIEFPEYIFNKKQGELTQEDLQLSICFYKKIYYGKIKALKEKFDTKEFDKEKTKSIIYYSFLELPPDVFTDYKKSKILEYVLGKQNIGA